MRFQTPLWSAMMVGLFVAVLAVAIDLGTAAALTNIGTLFVFILVEIGGWVMRIKNPGAPRKFRTPAYKLVTTLCVLICFALMISLSMVWQFVVWMGLGLALYLAWGIKHSALATE